MITYQHPLLRILPAIGLLAFGSSACQADGPEPPPAAIEPMARVEQTQDRGQRTRKEMQAMSLSDLAGRLQKDALSGREPFNSMAYREVVRRGRKAAPELVGSIDSGGREQLLTLLAGWRLDRDQYSRVPAKRRVSILTESLANAKSFNTWGLPHIYWEDAAQALIFEGEAARAPLGRLLTDKRAAPVWGSEEAIESQAYGFRVCDYAWALLLAIDGEQVGIPRESAQRDALIAAYADR